MFTLTGAAASSALDLIAQLQQTFAARASGTQGSSSTAGTDTSAATTFDPSAGTTASDITSGTSSGTQISPGTMSALLMQQGQSTAVNGDAFSQQLFSLLDTNGDGTISKSEFETAFGQNGNTTQADSIFAKLDANSDGSVSQSELTNALDGGQDQSQGMQGMHHHHHHHGGMGMGGASSSSGTSDSSSGTSGSGDSTDPLLQADGSSQTTANSDGSSTTTITYSDGSTVSMTTPVASGSGSGSTASNNSNFIERMIQRQAQLLASANAGQSLAVSV